MFNTTRIRKRPEGFTLLELLMVITIIGVLTTLSVTVMIGIDTQAKEAATITTIRKIDGLLEQRMQAFDRSFERGGPFKERYMQAARSLLRQDNLYQAAEDDSIVEILARKVGMRHLFPQRHEDLLLLNFDVTGSTELTDFDTTGDIKAVGSRSIDANDNRMADIVERSAADASKLAIAYPPNLDNGNAYINDSTVSAELMHFFMIHSASLGAGDAISDQFSTSEIADTDDDGLLEFVDAWGRPLRFYRWPTQMIDTNPPAGFQPFLASVEATDVDPMPDNDPLTDNTRGREITKNERLVATIMIKGMPPAPFSLPNGAVPRDLLLSDPDDPVGVLYRAMEEWGGLPGYTGPTFNTEFNETNYHTPDTYHTPLIVSSGADETLGLYEPSDTANLGNLAAYDLSSGFDTMLELIGDNLTNRNRRAGGRQ